MESKKIQWHMIRPSQQGNITLKFVRFFLNAPGIMTKVLLIHVRCIIITPTMEAIWEEGAS